jgi:hypothetical protein
MFTKQTGKRLSTAINKQAFEDAEIKYGALVKALVQPD